MILSTSLWGQEALGYRSGMNITLVNGEELTVIKTVIRRTNDTERPLEGFICGEGQRRMFIPVTAVLKVHIPEER